MSVHFHLLSKDGTCRLRRKLYCPDTGKEVDFGDTARGIEVGKDEYVLVDEKEIEADQARERPDDRHRAVRLARRDRSDLFRSRLFRHADGQQQQGLQASLRSDEGDRTIGLARFVMRDRQYVAALRVMGDGLVLHTMHYPDEVLSLDDALPGSLANSKPGTKEVQVARQLIDAMSKPLDLASFKDEYRDRIEDLVERKRQGKKTVDVADDHDDEPAAGRSI